jgi:hypothetical protein
MKTSFSACPLVVALLLLCGCGDPVAEHVEGVLAGGEEREEALMELLFAKADALPAIFAALDDPTQSSQGRADLVEVLWKLYIRESHPSILPALIRLIGDPAPQVRLAAARALGDMEKKGPIHPLLDQLQIERDEMVQLQILIALEILDGWEMESVGTSSAFKIGGGQELSPDERAEFVQQIKTIYKTAVQDTLRQQAEELLEKIVAQKTQDAQKAILKADLERAEREYLDALELKPDSRNALMSLAKFYYFNDQRSRGLELLEQNGMVLRIPLLAQTPVIDGDLGDPAWKRTARIDSFFQTIDMMRAVPIEGRSEAYVAYTDTSICLAVKGYEEDTQILVAKHTEHDSNLWQDDCVEVFFDTDLDQRTFYQIAANSLGAVFDTEYSADNTRNRDHSVWNCQPRIGIRVEPTFWSLEMEISFRDLGDVQVEHGAIWGFNVARVRIGSGAEHGAWMPTYGLALRPNRFGLLVFD